MPDPVPSTPAVPRGIYCPLITFFTDDDAQTLDLTRQSNHVRFLLDSEIDGLVVHGTTGESVLLSHEERNSLTGLVAEIRNETRRFVPIVVGCPAQSTREVIRMCIDARANGGDFALVLPPSYWVKAATTVMLQKFYTEVADKSPIPIIIYSFPAVTGGIDMDSDLLGMLAKHPNIRGIKLTCGNVGKLTRLTAIYNAAEFSVFGGSTEWLLPGLASKSCGAVSGLANTHPRACVELFSLFEAGKLDEAVHLQGEISKAEWAMGKTGISGTKYAVEWVRQFDSKVVPRRPLMECDDETKAWIEKTIGPLNAVEKMLTLRANGKDMNGVNGH